MKSVTIINVNEIVYFKPTPAAHAQYFAHYDGLAVMPMQVDKDGYSRMEFWQFMNIFGSLCFHGSGKLPTVDNEIEFRDKL